MKKRNRIKQGKWDVTFDIINISILIILVLLVLLPFLNLIALSFSNGIYNPQVYFLAKGFNLDAFRYVFSEPGFLKSVGNSVVITVIVTIFSNLFMALAAYPLSKSDCPFRKGILMFFVITMLFSAGIVPIYLLMSELGLTNTIWAVVLNSLMNVFNLLLYKTYFENIPTEIIEAAEIDGASNLRLFFKVILPISLPVVASCCFFTIVGTWNNYSGALLFISEPDAYPLSLYIYKLLQQTTESYTDPWKLINASNLQAATIVISILPILFIYPYVVKYINEGVTVGSVKE